ncbi:MAG: glycerate kinase [Clostridia bacterium]|nr:glycerate kinase [Clostridia bacterium]
MKKFILIPDSFKGTMSSKEICGIMKDSILKEFRDAEVVSVPVADGGEGSVDCFLTALKGKRVECTAKGPYFEEMKGFYGLIEGGKTAVIEMAAVAGLPLVEGCKNPLKTTTYGVGELILHAVKGGAKKIILGLGGSCTNDLGCGMASALGIEFFDDSNNKFIPTGESLSKIKKIDISNKAKELNGVQIVAMCDVDNLPYGKSGASYVFAAQKGADERAIEILDSGVKSGCNVIKECLGVDVETLKGGGAAGALGAGVVAFLGGQLKMGIDTVLETVGFEKMLENAHFVFTGEGKIDGQSLRGKVVIGVARASKKAGVPVIAVVGGAEGDMQKAYEEGVTAIFSINRMPEAFETARYKSQQNLAFAMDNLLKTLKINYK